MTATVGSICAISGIRVSVPGVFLFISEYNTVVPERLLKLEA